MTQATIPTPRAGVKPWMGNKKPVRLVSAVVKRNSAVVPGNLCEANIPPTAKTWYQLAVTSDGSTVRFYVNDLSNNEGFKETGSVELTGATPADNALASNGKNWTFGRGWYNSKFVDHLDGRLDEIRFSDTALKVEEFLKVK